MPDLRKLGAMDIAFLGYRLILAEYAFAILFSPALGSFIFVRGHSPRQVILGVYFICLEINFIPMLVWTIAVGNRENARAEVWQELDDRAAAMAKFRRISLGLLVPLLPVWWILARNMETSGRFGLI